MIDPRSYITNFQFYMKISIESAIILYFDKKAVELIYKTWFNVFIINVLLIAIHKM